MRTTSRLVALAAGSTLVLTGLSAPVQAAPGDRDPANAAIGWLTANGIDQAGNLGLAGDTALAMDQVDPIGYAEQIDAIWAYLSSNVNDTTTGPALAKSALVAQAAGGNTSDVINRLEAKVDDTSGEVADVTEYDGVIAQSLAAQALNAAGSPEAGAATAHLLAQQCPDGSFNAKLGSDCTAPDNDTTALAVVALAEIGEAEATTAGRTYLKSVQEPTGAWSSWGTPNANTTGMAAWALGESPEATRAATWLRGLQMADAPGCDVYKPVGDVADPQGGVVWSLDDLANAREHGVDDRSITSIAYATPQAAPALRWAEQATGERIQVTGPTRYLRAGTKVRIRVADVAVNDSFCLSAPGTRVPGTGAAAASRVDITLPARTRNFLVRVVDTQRRRGTHRLRVLGPVKFRVARKSKVRRGTKQNVRVTRLAPRERVVVRYGARVVSRGKANAKGVYRTSFNVGRRVGMRRIIVRGEFAAIRSGQRIFRVTR